AALAIARQALLQRIAKRLLARVGSRRLEFERGFAASHFGERFRRQWSQLDEKLLPPGANARAEPDQRLLEALQQFRIGVLAQQVVARAKRAQVFARIGEMGRMAVEHGAVEQPATA